MGRGERPMGFRQMGRGESTDSASLGQPICTEVSPCEFERRSSREEKKEVITKLGENASGQSCRVEAS